jgi:hypothetical protein
MIQSGSHLKYRLLRGFVAEVMYWLSHHSAVSAMLIDDEGIDDDSTAQLVKEVVYTAQRMTHLKELSPVITSMRYTLMRYTPMRYTPMRYTPMKCTPMRCTHQTQNLPVQACSSSPQRETISL